MARVALTALVGAVLVLAGCSKEPPKAPVKGTVTLDKKPLKEGQILFVTPGKAPEALQITDGNFEGIVEVGDRRVEILAYKEVKGGAMPGETPEMTKANYIQPRYNVDSQLRATIPAGGDTNLKFDLGSNP